MREVEASSTNSGPVGIGGWLILPIIGLAIVLAFGVLQVAILATRPSAIGDLFASPAFDLYGRVVILGGLALYTVMPLVPAVLLLMKSRHFPWTYIAWMLLFAGTVVLRAAIDGIFTSIVPVVWTILWTPYLLMSTRVKNTFVN
jgi:hypothetical protein